MTQTPHSELRKDQINHSKDDARHGTLRLIKQNRHDFIQYSEHEMGTGIRVSNISILGGVTP